MNSIFARVELVDVETGVLLFDAIPAGDQAHDKHTMGAFTLGGVHDIFRSRGFEGGLGAGLTFYAVPQTLQSTHGDHPVSFQIFLRLRPPAGPMGRMWNMRMSQPLKSMSHDDMMMHHQMN